MEGQWRMKIMGSEHRAAIDSEKETEKERTRERHHPVPVPLAKLHP